MTATKGRNCSIANALEVVGEKWSLLVLREIALGQRRFDEIAAGTGASRDILAARLRTLVDADVLAKRRYEDHPPRYEYVATESGKALYPILMALMEWGDAFATTGPPPTVVEHRCGEILHAQVVCAHCKEPLAAKDAHVVELSPPAR
ncbi:MULTISPECIES: winged helix-turn-helix transcriptional regulator [Rhodococcus]|jgi:DNA-binding HxlR family transcriptional regulator|uniref:winged helix-turn-helix transcriptional regulator n=1 Tax=Rhodococcus TaxID=1827 RepID=UPI0004C35FB7|nr:MULTISPECIES: helix-turn-helix domain-containing protein [Rhodococcus]ANQ70656.1 HxlR family transcriptional regulator [Rhodococcus sp. 008]KZF17533.1 HxlR family transcriptional regulator [Rhodococcus sp. EPR-134]MBQ7805826.1 helix-turn-helix transcriptional regulator [Rhodococcus sp. (in: high G+C Gram-positive bacteria)]MBW0283946.1 HxlR family transcriptional regulator [Rhodococcus sp. FH8]MBW0293224.1 HxlR family transcriptional regulator [Rhodococcus sp. MH15]